MKKILLITAALTMISLGAMAQNVNIPDANFKAYLVGNTNINTNGDTEIQVSEATAFTGAININNDGISDLTGIEHFTNLTYLIAPFNQLTSIDVSQNTALLSLNVQDNMLTSLDISQNTALTGLNCGRNNLSSLDVSQNVLLDFLLCHENNLSALDVYPLTKLITFNCSQNSITYLDFSQNTGINQNTSLEVPFIHCQENNLTVLKMNGISPGALQNQYFNATNNPNLTCIEVNDVTAAETNWTNIDATANFSLQCTVDIPDAAFKACLVGNTSINTNGDTEIQVSEATAFTQGIYCPDLGISDLTGIEAFVNINAIYGELNNLTSIDISNNTQITYLGINNNNLSSIDVSSNTQLTNLTINNNNLTSLDISSNTNLQQLIAANNSISSLDVSSNTALVNMNVTNNNLTSLDISANIDLQYFYCSLNNLTALNAANGNNTAITGFVATSNPNLTCIEVDDVAWSTTNWTNIDATAGFSTDCNYLVSSISVQGQNNTSTISTFEGSLQIEATVLPTYAEDITYTWSVSNGTGSATIDANGLLSAVSDGTVTVTATANDGSGVSGDMVVTISNQIVLVSAISVQGQAGATAITTDGGTLQMEATVSPVNATDASYVWSVTNGTGAATIDANGLLMAVSNGTVTVTATANDGSEITGDVTITISNQVVLSINDQQKNREWVIYPNPVTSVLNLDFNTTIEAISIVDFTGKPIKTIPSPKRVFDVSDLAIGIYFFQIKTDQGLMSKKFVKQ
ncbi:Ig-like domain-containing protein [Reichenbachiella carrageenanivorans]|uniref:Ig-like domain-containing protein n=1 Tax=Reichenbachiella carrageenanivorans TaxID=2979869 RepID=A0ABY6D2G4_9BACT|nr:Ig-like domain-containing protein [Reichenbachiella carrageenanivorans]UXX79939.1 Ig-like domain-containing protein [Reichenbachiella carrageenanivorans]